MKRKKEEGAVNITGGAIRGARIRAGLTQEELSNRLELMAIYVCRGSISRIENGERSVNDIELEAIARVLGIPLEQLFPQG